ncbi:hypothetical protein [Onishia taeanensis]|nr:hypothetical protein [Halomonas taeanensis]
MTYCGERNVTPQQMIDLKDAALAYIKKVYAHSWARKDAIKVNT